MSLQRILADGEEELVVPAGVVAGVEVENNRDESLDVLDSQRLGVEVGDGRRFMEEEGLTKIARIRDVGGLLVGEGISVAVRRVGGGALLGGASEGVTSALLRSLAIEDGSAGFGRCLGLGVGSCLCLGIGGG